MVFLQRILPFCLFCIHDLVFWRGIGSLSSLFFSIAFPDMLKYYTLYILGTVGSIELHVVRMLYMIPFCF